MKTSEKIVIGLIVAIVIVNLVQLVVHIFDDNPNYKFDFLWVVIGLLIIETIGKDARIRKLNNKLNEMRISSNG